MPYFAPNQPEFNYLRHLQLMACDPRQPMTEEQWSYYVSHIAPDGHPDDWFFDSFLLFTSRAQSGNSLYYDINLGESRSGEGDFFAVPSPNPGTAEDWRAVLDHLFAPGDGVVARLERAVETAAKRLGAPPHTRNVVLTIPYPHETQWAFGELEPGGPRINFSILRQDLVRATEQRLAACEWYVRESIRRWNAAAPKNLNLLGFYWVYETLHYSWDVDDHWLLKHLYPRIRETGNKFFWIPFYSTFNVHLLSDARGFYFDAAFLQPNHLFYMNIPGVGEAAEAARARGAGIEMEFYAPKEKRYPSSLERDERWRNYLDGGIEYGYMTESACAYFNGFNDLEQLAKNPDAVERAIYDDMFHFVRGDYRPRAKQGK